MSEAPSPIQPPPWSRAQPARSGPRRSAGGLYRTAERKDPSLGNTPPDNPGPVLGGVPLNSANTAVVAAVRLAYQVAEAQVDRSLRLARRLRETGDREVGGASDTKGLEATERLVMNAMLSGLEWWEGSVAEGRCPVKRLAAAEYNMIGQILGFAAPQGKKTTAGTAPASAPRPQAPGAPTSPARAARQVQVVLAGDKNKRRRVVVQSCELDAQATPDTEVFFFHADQVQTEPVSARVEMAANAADLLLVITVPPGTPTGLWTCALCDDRNVQVGHIEIAL